MKILIYSHTFWPNIGGVEDVGHVLATNLSVLGHDVTVLTPTPSQTERDCVYQIVRTSSPFEEGKLIASHDIVHSNGISTRLLMPCIVKHKPFTWTHHGYQLQCLDGAGWTNGEPAPLDPLASFQHHVRVYGIGPALQGGLKLWLRRLASGWVSANISSSRHLAQRQPSAKMSVIYNPIDVGFYRVSGLAEAKRQLEQAASTFTFMGRLITEKGVDDLLHAFAIISDKEERDTGKRTATLKIIGSGPEEGNLRKLASELKVSEQITWVPSKTGAELKQQLLTSGICIIPSAWEEPGALIVMNLLAAGKPLIVSEMGWLSECAGDACVKFPNRDRAALAAAMDRLRHDRELQRSLIERGLARIEAYRVDASVQGYIDVFRKLVNDRENKQ